MTDNTEVPLHLRQPSHPPIDQDCDDVQKIVITPVYRGRLEESHERTRRALQRTPWYVARYNRFLRDTQLIVDNNSQRIFAVLTYITGGLMLAILLVVGIKMLIAIRKDPNRFKISS